MRGLVDRAWLKSIPHRDKVAFADLSTASPELAEWVGKLIRRAARMGIPLAVESATYDVAFIVHSRRRRDLHPLEWNVIAHLGREISQQYGLGIAWGGPMMASCWLGGPPARAISPAAAAREGETPF